jgi:hypothetical protein
MKNEFKKLKYIKKIIISNIWVHYVNIKFGTCLARNKNITSIAIN